MTFYRFGANLLDSESPEFAEHLAAAHSGRKRPLCICCDPPLEMYVAKAGDTFLIKRMPDTGPQHAVTCVSHEPPPELSGLGEVMGSAIRESPEDGLTTLKLDFSLSKVPGRAFPAAAGRESDSVKSDTKKLTLRALLHYLWEQAELNRWTPAMAGRRAWRVVFKYLMQAAEAKAAKGVPLVDSLFIPEPYSPEHRNEIAGRRVAKLQAITAGGQPSRRKLMVIIAEVKELAPARFGHKIIAKHLPDFHLFMADELHKRMLKRFQVELEMWDARKDCHLVMIGTFGVSAGSGIAQMDELSLVLMNEQWLPIEGAADKSLIDALVASQRSFVRSLRYNLASSRPLAAAVLTDTKPKAIAMYVVPSEPTEEFESALRELVDHSTLPAWIWYAAASPLPALPEKVFAAAGAGATNSK